MSTRYDDEFDQAKYRADPRDEAMVAQIGGDRVVTLPTKAKPEEARPRFAFVHISDYLGELKPPEWLIRGVVETDSLLMIFGDPESGKSFLAMDWAASVAAGREWQGCAVKQGPVLYINGEGRNGINRRFKAWQIANQCDLQAQPIFFSTVTTALTDDVSRAEIEAVIAEFIRVHGHPVLIVIDTLARNFGPGDENSTQDMTQAIATCDAIREITRAVVALVHHSGHGDKNRARGAMALHGALDAEYRMQRVPEAKETTFECTKMKDADKPAPMQFRFCSVELGLNDDHGQPVTSAVLKPTDYLPPEQSGMPSRGRRPGAGKHPDTALEQLWKLHSRCISNVVSSGRDASEASVSVNAWRDNCVAVGMSRQRFFDARQTLVTTGRVRVDHGFAYPLEAM